MYLTILANHISSKQPCCSLWYTEMIFRLKSMLTAASCKVCLTYIDVLCCGILCRVFITYHTVTSVPQGFQTSATVCHCSKPAQQSWTFETAVVHIALYLWNKIVTEELQTCIFTIYVNPSQRNLQNTWVCKLKVDLSGVWDNPSVF